MKYEDMKNRIPNTSIILLTALLISGCFSMKPKNFTPLTRNQSPIAIGDILLVDVLPTTQNRLRVIGAPEIPPEVLEQAISEYVVERGIFASTKSNSDWKLELIIEPYSKTNFKTSAVVVYAQSRWILSYRGEIVFDREIKTYAYNETLHGPGREPGAFHEAWKKNLEYGFDAILYSSELIDFMASKNKNSKFRNSSIAFEAETIELVKTEYPGISSAIASKSMFKQDGRVLFEGESEVGEYNLFTFSIFHKPRLVLFVAYAFDGGVDPARGPVYEILAFHVGDYSRVPEGRKLIVKSRITEFKSVVINGVAEIVPGSIVHHEGGNMVIIKVKP